MVGLYDYMKGYCVCSSMYAYVRLFDLNGDEVEGWPLNVYDVEENLIGLALDKQQYIDIWNSSFINQVIGTLSGWEGPFNFSIALNNKQVSPQYVIGDLGIPLLALIDENGDPLIDETNEILVDA